MLILDISQNMIPNMKARRRTISSTCMYSPTWPLCACVHLKVGTLGPFISIFGNSPVLSLWKMCIPTWASHISLPDFLPFSLRGMCAFVWWIFLPFFLRKGPCLQILQVAQHLPLLRPPFPNNVQTFTYTPFSHCITMIWVEKADTPPYYVS